MKMLSKLLKLLKKKEKKIKKNGDIEQVVEKEMDE
tara:strand:+ start:3847 stop:3951 length:105 start_codon:yes stop_codon:yes gene_type:complete